MPAASERRVFLLFYTLQSSALLAVLIPFVRFNNLLEWDFPGHFAAIWHVKTHLLPWPSGWNPFFYCGYPQGVFYPPLAHFLAALLALPLGISAAIKALLALSIMALPLAFYALARRAGLEVLNASVSATWMVALLFLSGEMLGGCNFGTDLHSILNVGLFANALSLPVLFAFFAACGNCITRTNWKLVALLLGILLLLHPLSSLIAIVFLTSTAVVQWWKARHGDLDWKPVLCAPVAAVLLGSFWVLPYLAFRKYMNPEFLDARWSPQIIFLVVNGAILAVVGAKKEKLRPLAVSYVALANFIIVGSLCELPIQFTRLTIYLFFLIPILLLALIRSRTLVLFLAGIAVIVGIFGYRNSGLNPRGVPDFDLPDFGRLEGRVLSVAPPSHLPSYHVNHDLIPLRTGNQETLGLFIEASLNGRFLANLMRTIEPDAYVWGTPTEGKWASALGSEYPRYLRERLRLFDIRYIYTDLRLEDLLDPSLATSKRYINSTPVPRAGIPADLKALGKRFNISADRFDFYLYPVGPGALAEALPYLPKAPGTDWKLTSKYTFLELTGAPVFTDGSAPPGAREARAGETVELLSQSGNQDRIGLKINAAGPIPVLVKVGYFPSWKLTLNGRPAPVYRASPNLILFYGQGEAFLEYHRPWQEYAGLALTVLGAAALLLL